MSKSPLFAAALALLAGSAVIRPMFDHQPDRGEIRIPKHKPKGAPPPPNPRAERRKMLKVRAMQDRKKRKSVGLP